MGFANDFRMDSPLVAFGSKVYQPDEPVNIVYDMFAVPAALIRGVCVCKKLMQFVCLFVCVWVRVYLCICE